MQDLAISTFVCVAVDITMTNNSKDFQCAPGSVAKTFIVHPVQSVLYVTGTVQATLHKSPFFSSAIRPLCLIDLLSPRLVKTKEPKR